VLLHLQPQTSLVLEPAKNDTNYLNLLHELSHVMIAKLSSISVKF
jgi:hypothetical protein